MIILMNYRKMLTLNHVLSKFKKLYFKIIDNNISGIND